MIILDDFRSSLHAESTPLILSATVPIWHTSHLPGLSCTPSYSGKGRSIKNQTNVSTCAKERKKEQKKERKAKTFKSSVSSEFMCFHLFHSNQHSNPLILGFPWLKEHNPHIDWSTGKVLNWAGDCTKCLKSCHDLNMKPVFNTVVHPDTDPELPDLKSVPGCYHDLGEIFSKSKATSLPLHRPYDCPIELIPGAPIPRWRLYSISGPEREAMTEYIEFSLKAGLVYPSSSPAGAGFFFVGKKDGSLRPCIDYGPLNDITIKNRYPLPLMSSAFDQLQQAKIFTKLDLRNAYHLVRI